MLADWAGRVPAMLVETSLRAAIAAALVALVLHVARIRSSRVRHRPHRPLGLFRVFALELTRDVLGGVYDAHDLHHVRDNTVENQVTPKSRHRPDPRPLESTLRGRSRCADLGHLLKTAVG